MRKYISVLLAAFVFVMGMISSNCVNAATENTADKVLEPILKKTDKLFKKQIKLFNEYDQCKFDFKVDGAKDFKRIKKSKDEEYYTGTVEEEQNIKIHGIIIPVPLETYSKQMKKTLPYTIRKYTAKITVQAKKDNKIIKEVTKSYTDKTDNVVDFKVPQDVTSLVISVYLSDYVSTTRKDDWSLQDTEPPQTIVLAVVPASAAGEESENGISWVYLGGGLFALLIGGGAIFFFTGGGGATLPEPSKPPEPPEPEPEPSAPSEPEYFNYKDPAGFETLYMKDPETGNWYNYQDYQEGYRTPVDMDKLQEYDAQRRQDVKWNQDQMQKLQNRETGLDMELKEEHRQMLEREKQIQQETKKDLYALERGTFGMSNEERKTFLEERQARDQKDADKWTKRGDAWDKITTAAEVVQTTADIGVDILATVTAPVGGGLVADAYALTKNVAGSGMEGLVNKDRTLLGGLAEGFTKGGIDVAQNHSGTKWQKILSYVGGEGIKGGIDAGLKGESIVKGTFKGALQGGTKLGVDAIGKKIGDKITKNTSDSLKHAFEHGGDIRRRIAPQVSEKSAKALQQMNIQKHLANYYKGEHQTLANTITNGVTRNLLPKIFG